MNFKERMEELVKTKPDVTIKVRLMSLKDLSKIYIIGKPAELLDILGDLCSSIRIISERSGEHFLLTEGYSFVITAVNEKQNGVVLSLPYVMNQQEFNAAFKLAPTEKEDKK